MRCGNITALTIFWIFAHENNDLHCAEMSFLRHLPSMNFWYAIGARNDWCLPIWSVDYIEEAFWKPSYHKFPVFHSSEFSKYHPVACNYLRVVLAGSWSLAKWSGVDSLSIDSFLFCSFTLLSIGEICDTIGKWMDTNPVEKIVKTDSRYCLSLSHGLIETLGWINETFQILIGMNWTSPIQSINSQMMRYCPRNIIRDYNIVSSRHKIFSDF